MSETTAAAPTEFTIHVDQRLVTDRTERYDEGTLSARDLDSLSSHVLPRPETSAPVPTLCQFCAHSVLILCPNHLLAALYLGNSGQLNALRSTRSAYDSARQEQQAPKFSTLFADGPRVSHAMRRVPIYGVPISIRDSVLLNTYPFPSFLNTSAQPFKYQVAWILARFVRASSFHGVPRVRKPVVLTCELKRRTHRRRLYLIVRADPIKLGPFFSQKSKRQLLKSRAHNLRPVTVRSDLTAFQYLPRSYTVLGVM
jgi:hypothetical protein